MSLITLTSSGQRSSNFRNDFPASINVGRNAELCLLGYSCHLGGEASNGAPITFPLFITEDINDTMAFYRGTTTAGAATNQIYYNPVIVKLNAGQYSETELATEIQNKLNEAEYCDQYKGGWSCSSAANIFTIKSGYRRAPVNSGGEWLCYSGQVGGVTNTAPNSIISPFQANNNRESFINLESGYIGDSTNTVGSLGACAGFETQFTTVGVGYKQCQFTIGCFPVTWATRCKRNLQASNGGRNAPIIWDGSRPINADVDFAYAKSDETEKIGYMAVGLTIRIDGQIGIVTTKLGQDGNPKGDANRLINWTVTNLGGAGPKKLGISPRYDLINNFPVMECMADVGAGWVSLGTIPMTIDNETDLYRITDKLQYGVVFDPDYIDDGANPPLQQAVDVTCLSIETGSASGGPANPTEDVTLISSPFMTNISVTDTMFTAGLDTVSNKCNALSQQIGFLNDFLTEPLTSVLTTGFIGDDISTVTQMTNFGPIMVTCPDLGARGYVGGANGAESQILGICNLQENFDEDNLMCSGSFQENWIKLHNSHPLTITHLNIILKDLNNVEVNYLEPSFNCWLKFRADAPKANNRETTSIGSFSTTY